MFAHESVLLDEAITGLNIQPNGCYVDATFGRGGHSEVILSRLVESGQLIAFDKDPEAVAYAKTKFEHDKRFSIHHASFSELNTILGELGLERQVNGILFDLGVSSPQLDNPERGFSFMKSGPLDMRMNTEAPMSASEFINTAPEDLLIKVFQEYGEEKFARRIANAIALQRKKQWMNSTQELAEVIKQANPRWEKHKHPATRVFQAIRIYVNQELEELKCGLENAVEMLAPAGRLVVISFHSLEDRMVKQFMKLQAEGEPLPPRLPIPIIEKPVTFKRISKAIKPTEAEMRRNVRARSAVMRIGEKLI